MSPSSINLSDLDGKLFALLLMGETEVGQDDWAVFGGTARVDAGVLYLDRGAGQRRFEIRSEWIDRIKPVPAEAKATLLDAEFYLPLSVAQLPADADIQAHVHTGLKWPK